MEPQDKTGHRAGLGYLLVFLVLAVGIVASGFFFYGNYRKHFRAEIALQLSSIAELKVSELEDWRAERLQDAAVFYKNVAFSNQVRRFFEKPNDPMARDQVWIWLIRFQAAYGYSRVFLLDAHGVERLSAPDTLEPAVGQLEQAPQILRSKGVTFMDFHRDTPDGPIHLSVLVPVLQGGEDTPVVGILVLRIDPQTYLYPYITRWPTPSRTAETLLVRRDGNDVLFLNELRFQKNTALTLRISLGNKDVPAVKAALGQEGIVEGRDYRGVPVLADVRAVPGSPWFLVARMDIAEAYAPMRERLWVMIVLAGSLLLGAGGGIGFLWWHQRVRFYRERYEAADALKASEASYRRLFEAAKDGILIVDVETGNVLDVNPFLIEMLGFTHAQIVGKPIWDLGFLKDVAASKEKFRELHKRGYVRFENLPLETADGRRIDVEFISNVYEVDHKQVVQCNIRDITARKRAEAATRESEARFRTLYENSTLGLYMTTPDGRIVLANPALVKMLGFSSFEDLSGRDLKTDGFEPSYPRAHFIEMLEREGTVKGLESAWKRRDGTTVIVRESARAIRDPAGRTVYFDGTVEDITDRRRAEDALAYEQSLLRALMDNVLDQVYFKDEQSRFSKISKAQAERFGLSDAAQAVGKTDFDFFAEDHARQAFEDEQKIMKTGRPLVDLEEKETWPDGRIAWVSTTKVPLHDNQGRVIGTVGISRDITTRKQAEERLNETLQRLRLAVTSTIRVMGMMVEARDPFTAGHQQKTTILAEAIAVEMGLPQERIEGLRMAGQVHDVGKISIPAEILSKPTGLTSGEYRLVQTHAQKGYEILKDVEFPWPIAEIVHQHHERRDGSGYPRGLKGDEIIMEARILAVSDTVEAMASHRPYRPAPGIGVALEEIDRNKGVLYDPDVVAACLKLFREKGFTFES